MPNAINFDDIKLPDNEGDKPVENKRDPLEVVTDNKPTDNKPADTKPGEAAPDKKTDEPAKPSADAAPVVPDPGAETLNPDGTKKEVAPAEDPDKLKPFHEHPDWIKSQQEKKDLEKHISQLEGRIEEISKNTNKTTEVVQEEARKSAEERLQADIDAGWKPDTQAELYMRGMKYMREDLAAEKQAEIKAREDESESIINVQKELIENARTAYDELAITDTEQRKKVGEYIAARENDGLITPNAKNIAGLIKWAVEDLTAKGELTAAAAVADPPKPVKTAEQIAQETKQKEVNAKIGKPGTSDGDATKKTKKSYADMHNNDMDKIVFNVKKAVI